MPVPNSKDWRAIENRMPPVDRDAVPFYVVGQVETNNGAILPVLKPAVPQGTSPAILILELTLEQSGDFGTTDIAYRDARFDTTVSWGQYSGVLIRFEGEQVASVEVQVVH